MQKRLRLGHRGLLLVTTALMPLLVNCEVDAVATPPPAYGTVQVTTPPPPPPAQGDVTVGTPPPPDQGAEVADTDPSALADFHQALDPYGTWVDDAAYGTIWFPNRTAVGNDFTPYMTAGHWVYDNNDYLWVSDYDWGWAPFHYGRWLQTPRGWGWIPGHEYAGAWVTWRNGDDGYGYVGWAPTPPTYYWRGGVAVNVPPPEPTFVYLQTSDLFAPNVGVRVVPRARYREIEGRTRVYAPQRGTGGERVIVRGPPPTRFGINMNAVPRAPANNPGLARAQQFRVRPVARPANPGNPNPGAQRPGDFRGAPPQGGQPQGGVRPGEQRPNEFRGAPPQGGQPQGGVRPGEQRPNDFHGAPPQGQPGGHPSGVDNRPDVHGQPANHPSGAQLPPDARTRPLSPTQEQMHAAPAPTSNNNRRTPPPERKR